MKIYACLISAAAISTTAGAEVFGPGPGGSISRAHNGGGHGGGIGGGGSDIVLNRPGEIVTSIDSVTIHGLQHTWVGALQIWFKHQESNSWAGLHSGTGAESANVNGDYTFRVDPSLPTLFEASKVGGVVTIPGGDYALFQHANEAPTRGDFSDMIGESLSGSWMLLIQNGSFNDGGSFTGWSFSGSASPVPEPTSMAVLGLGVLALHRRRSKTGAKT